MICLDYRSNILIFCSLSVLLSLSGVVNAADFNITTLQNITDNCDYNSGTYTYNCSVDSNGDVWDNINVLTSINLLNTHGTYKADSDNIIFQAKNEFYAISTIDASGTRGGCSDNGAGGSGGSITINAKSINVTSLSSVGAYCRDLNKCRLCNTGGRGGAIYLNGVDVGVSGNLNLYGGYGTEASGGGGGTVSVIADNFYGNSINVYGSSGHESGGNAGRIYLTVKNNITTKNINAYGGVGNNNRGGSGGVLTINSENTIIDGNLNLYGNYGDYPGGAGGSVSINTDILSLNGVVNVYGNYGRDRYAYGGSGGILNIFAKNISQIGAISASAGTSARGASGRSGGTVKIITENDLVLPSITAVGSPGGSGDGDNSNYASGAGGSGGNILVVAPKLNISGPINANAGVGGNGDETRGGNGGSGRQIIIYSNDIIYSGALISSKGGNGGWERTWAANWRHNGAGGDGGDVYIFTDDSLIIENYNIDVSKGISGHSPGTDGNKATGDRTVPTGFRLTSTIKELNTNNLFIGSTQIRIIDPESSIYVPITKTYNAWFGETDIGDGQVNSLFGDKPLMVMLAKTYYLEVTTSDDLFFSKANCDLGLANCDTHFVEFRQYYN